jgi:hypothetical protein
MTTRIVLWLLVSVLGTLVACATAPEIGEDAAALTARLGAPTVMVRLASSERWFYATGPSGTTTRVVELVQSRVAAVTNNVLTDTRFGDIVAGVTSDEVLAQIGPPYRRMRFDNLRATAWDYHFQDSWGYRAELSVMIGDDQRVVNKVVQRVDAERSER